MRRVFGSLAVFAGWLCILLGGAAGFVSSGLAKSGGAEGTAASTHVYGVHGLLVFWLFVFVALGTVVPLVFAVFAEDATRPLYAGAIVMGAVGLALLPDELGRLFALLLFPGAVFMAGGARLIQAQRRLDAVAVTPGGAIVEAGVDDPPALADAPEAAAVAEPERSAEPEPAEAPELAPAEARAPEPAVAPEPALAPEPGPAAEPEPAPAAEPAFAPAPASADAKPCPWCSEPAPAAAKACPSCGAPLEGSDPVAEIPLFGITEVHPDLRKYQAEVARKAKKRNFLSRLMASFDEPYGGAAGKAEEPAPVLLATSPSALEPPSPEVRAAMRRIEIELSGSLPEPDAVPAEPVEEVPGQPVAVELPAAVPPPPEAPADSPPQAPAPPRRRGSRKRAPS